MPRKAKPPEMYREIPVYAIERMARLVPIKAKLDALHGPGAWGRDEVVDYMLGEQKRKAEEEQKPEDARALAGRVRAQNLGRKRAAYLRSLSDVTPADTVMIDQMCEIELQLEELSTPPDNAKETGTSLKARSDVRIRLIGELRRIQNDLGIGRSTRLDEIDQTQVVKTFVEGAAALVAERGIRIECPHCKGTTKINQGIIIFNFAKHVHYCWTSTCPNPKCGLEFTLEGGPVVEPV